MKVKKEEQLMKTYKAAVEIKGIMLVRRIKMKCETPEK
jgi:hypothetical protein